MNTEQQETDRIISEIIIGNSVAIQEVRRKVAQVAPTNATVLITGETGAGKEVVAEAIHKASLRRYQPFNDVNCSVFHRGELIQSELFGHVRHAFKDAEERKGVFEQANNGTLFLDEVGDMPPEAQAQFLRVLEEKKFQKLGGDRDITVDVRVITATNINLQTAIAERRFRRDLYRRLKVFWIPVPPLREHSEDIPLLVKMFISEFSKQHHKPVTGITRDALDYLQNADWPENVGGLRNAIESAIVYSTTAELQPKDFPEEPDWASAQTVSPEVSSDNKQSVQQGMADQYAQQIVKTTIQALAPGGSPSFPMDPESGQISSVPPTTSDETQMDWHTRVRRALDSIKTHFENQGLDIKDFEQIKSSLLKDIEDKFEKLQQAITPNPDKAETFRKVLNAYAKENDPDAWRSLLEVHTEAPDRLFNTLVALLAEDIKLEAIKQNAPYYKINQCEIYQFYTKGALNPIYDNFLKPMLTDLRKAFAESGENNTEVEKNLNKNALTQLNRLCDRFSDKKAGDVIKDQGAEQSPI